MAKGFAKPQNVGKTFARLFGYLRPHLGKLILTALFLLINSLSGVVGTYLLKPIFNIAAEMFKTGSRDFGPILRNILLLAGVYIAGVAANYGVNRLLLRVNTGVLYQIRCEMYEHLEKLPLKYFDSRTHGEIMSRFTNDTDTLREMLSNDQQHGHPFRRAGGHVPHELEADAAGAGDPVRHDHAGGPPHRAERQIL